ncbi:hypothetical protein LINPERHAP1_LOCUS17100, partial [Linum perenne]
GQGGGFRFTRIKLSVINPPSSFFTQSLRNRVVDCRAFNGLTRLQSSSNDTISNDIFFS